MAIVEAVRDAGGLLVMRSDPHVSLLLREFGQAIEMIKKQIFPYD